MVEFYSTWLPTQLLNYLLAISMWFAINSLDAYPLYIVDSTYTPQMVDYFYFIWLTVDSMVESILACKDFFNC
jgi:hypothetical protein